MQVTLASPLGDITHDIRLAFAPLIPARDLPRGQCVWQRHPLSGLAALPLDTFELALAPFAIAGLLAGSRVHLKLSREQFTLVVAMLAIISGISLLIRSAAF